MENRGIEFADNDDREAEQKRLAGLTDDAFTATEAAVKRVKKKEEKKEEPDPDENSESGEKNKKPAGKKSKADAGGGMNANAGVRLFDVDDGKESSLEESLKTGFMAAYNERVGASN
jgi:adenine-specific DNA-methyltransferase